MLRLSLIRIRNIRSVRQIFRLSGRILILYISDRILALYISERILILKYIVYDILCSESWIMLPVFTVLLQTIRQFRDYSVNMLYHTYLPIFRSMNPKVFL